MPETSAPAPDWHWEVALTPGENPTCMRLSSEAEVFPVVDATVPTAVGDHHAETACYRLAGQGWLPGWYELRGRLTKSDQVLASLHLCPLNHHQARPTESIALPYPNANGDMRMLLQLLHPADTLFFCTGLSHPWTHARQFSLRRVTRMRALWRMLMGAEKHEGWWAKLRHGMWFILGVLRGGIPEATTTLYAHYRDRVLIESGNAYIRRVSEATNPVVPESGRTPETALKACSLDGENTSAQAQALRLAREYRLLASRPWFDADYYLKHHPDVRDAGLDPLLHFCQYGWKLLYNPNADFDVWWYWATHLDPARETINPLVHYALVGQAHELDTFPEPGHDDKPGALLPEGRPVRRACLFAGHDPDGMLDACVVDYLRELARHADVWYLADGRMRPGELDKLAGLVRGAWCEPHGAYDFGSWSRLARDHAGWDVLQDYDEVVLANDSCYLLRSLDEVFARMDATACDWWGMQATKGLYATRERASNRFREPIPMDRVRADLLPGYAHEDPCDFHVGSYFLALRKPVLADAGLRRRLDAVVPQENKANIIGKYEIGIGRYLMAAGHPFATFIDHLYPFHPIYSDTAFTLLEEGFPFLKRYLLAENHYQVPDLANWKQRVLRVLPDAPVERIERNLLRTSNYEKLHRSMGITRDDSGRVRVPEMLGDKAFARADASASVQADCWAFPVCAFTEQFTGNERALFEAVKNDASIRKIVLTRSRHVAVDGENTIVVPLRSREGQEHLMRAGQIFIKHSPTRNIIHPVSPDKHNIINLWHGVPLKRIGHASLDMRSKLDRLAIEHRKCRAVIAASKVDAMAMAAAFYPLSYHDVWVTGLPRHDFILRRQDALPPHLREQSTRLARLLDGRRLVLFVPTFKQSQGRGGYYPFRHDELKALERWLQANHAVLGVREHMADRAHTYGRMLGGIGALDLGHESFPDIEMLYRHAAALITDYSSSFIDFMLTGQPMVSFAYDYDNYTERERGLFYDMEWAFPGPVCKTFPRLMQALEHVFYAPDEQTRSAYEWKRRLFLDYRDDANADRLVRKVKALRTRT